MSVKMDMQRENISNYGELSDVRYKYNKGSVQGVNKMKGNNAGLVNLNEKELSKILNTIMPSANQERRFVQTLAREPNIPTKQACINIGCVNLSDLRQRTVRTLARFNLEARCISPTAPIMNTYGEVTGQKLWGLYLLDANRKIEI